jgi:hypothetical protein
MKKMTHYQTRISKLVWASNIYLVACPIALVHYDSTSIGWLVYFSTATVNFCLAAGCDAVFDSLTERLNIQSTWLQVRLSVLERAVHSSSGQGEWRDHGVPTDDAEHYYYNYPERLET